MRELTQEELKLLELLRTAVVVFAGLPQAHPADMEEFVGATHVLQNIVLSRPATESIRKGDGEEVE